MVCDGLCRCGAAGLPSYPKRRPQVKDRNGRAVGDGPAFSLTFAAPLAIASLSDQTARRRCRFKAPDGDHPREDSGMSKEITAPMPGKVIEIMVAVGEEVLEYQEVLVLEAMKMENAIPSPVAGKVKAIKVNPGDTVAAKQVLMELE
jgi:biotin carboxyl carrier protein